MDSTWKKIILETIKLPSFIMKQIIVKEMCSAVLFSTTVVFKQVSFTLVQKTEVKD